jgi:hypothetical protein
VHGAWCIHILLRLLYILGRHSMDEALWTEYMDRPITPPNLGDGDRGQSPPTAHHANAHPYTPYQPEKKCIDAMLARSPNLHFGFFLLLVIFVSFSTADSVQSADCR